MIMFHYYSAWIGARFLTIHVFQYWNFSYRLFLSKNNMTQLHQVENHIKIPSSLERYLMIFPFKMSVLRNKKILAAVNQVSQEQPPGNNLSQDTNVLRVSEDCITQVSEQIEERLTKTLPQEFNRPNSQSIGALSKLDDFILYPQIQFRCGTVQ